MSNTVNRLHQHNAVVFKVILFLITASAIVYLFPKRGQFKYDFTKGKPWQYNNLIAPFDFAIEKSPEEIEKEIQRIRINSKPYFLYDKNIVEEVKEDYELRCSFIRASDSLSDNEIALMVSTGRSIITAVYDRGFLEPSSSKVVANQNEIIAIKKDTEVEDIIYNNLMNSVEVSDLIKNRLSSFQNTYSKNLNLHILSEIIQPNVSYDNRFTQKVIDESIRRSPSKGKVSKIS